MRTVYNIKSQVFPYKLLFDHRRRFAKGEKLLVLHCNEDLILPPRGMMKCRHLKKHSYIDTLQFHILGVRVRKVSIIGIVFVSLTAADIF